MQQARYQFPKKTLRDIPLHGKRILVRADFNVPLSENGEIDSDYRITQTLPTLQYLLERGCAVTVVAHLGRPEGKADERFSLEPVAQYLKDALSPYMVHFVPSTIDDKARQASKKLNAGELLLLENLRFHPGEEANDPDFAAALHKVAQADYFVQDGFGVVHRAHASTEAITHLLPSVAGLLLEKEVSMLESSMSHPAHPLVAIVGGAKISDKINFIEALLSVADTVLIGGAMANTFLKAKGYLIGKSVFEAHEEKEIATILQKAKPNQVVLPVDVAVASEIANKSQRRECELTEIKNEDIILDVGAESINLFETHLSSAACIIWNGTLGYAELPQFAMSSAAIAKAITNQHGVTSIVGGGDTADFALDWLRDNPHANFSHISTGGGASLELMSGMKLPGVEALLAR